MIATGTDVKPKDRTRERIAEPGRVGEDVPNGRRPGCRAEPIGAGRRIERFKLFKAATLFQCAIKRPAPKDTSLLR
jgi:hypothetical protein